MSDPAGPRSVAVEPAVALRPFSQSLPMALLLAREAAMKRFRPHLAEFDLTEQQWRVLRALASASDALEVGELARSTALLPPSLSRILSNLEARSLIARTSVPHDQRRAHIALAPGGHDLVRRVAPGSEARYNDIEACFGAERLSALLDELHGLTLLLTDAGPFEEPIA